MSKCWNIYGKKHDLTDFLDKHPGGKRVLLLSEGNTDLTSVFESYHAFSNKESIRKMLSKYEIQNITVKKQYDFTNYNKLLNEIKTTTEFSSRNSVKATFFWGLQNTVVLFSYCASFYMGMFSNYSVFTKCGFSFLAGLFYISLGFNVMHDASHYGVSIFPKVNNLFDKLWQSWGLWNANVWFYHHVLHHHSFTGEHSFDPDLYHLNPFYNKEKSKKQTMFHGNENMLPLLLTVFPGQHLGQAVMYMISQLKHKIFQIPIPEKPMYDTVDKILLGVKIYCLYQGLFLPTICYLISLNLWYHLNIIFDHDTYETAVENHYEGNDWLKLQVCNSGNFVNDNIVWTKLFGAINFQIEHHLFPNMSNVHYPTVAPIVKRFCRENNIPYVNHPTLFGAYKSLLKMIRFHNS